MTVLLTQAIGHWDGRWPTLFPVHTVNPDTMRELPHWLRLPGTIEETYIPALVALFFGVSLRWIPVNNGTRVVMKSLSLVLAVRYFIWRTTATLNFYSLPGKIFSIALYSLEAISLISLLLYTLQTLWSTDRRRSAEADRYERLIHAGEYCPSVDVFIPTYNEPEYIVRRTVMGCQAMNYANKTIYILDDTRREHIKVLAAQLGCEYITRPNNDHAKAGNLNHALPHTHGELIALMDADFVPFRNFLDRTVGFFHRPEISLVQTPQSFYNPDYHARNLGLDHCLPNDLEHFYGALQSHRDVFNSVICCGSCYVVRRSSLEAVGGYFTKCCVEDYQTSLKLLMNGAQLVYLNERLSMGESTRTFVDFLDQRLRWLQGNFQVYFCGPDLPLWRKLNWVQQGFLVNQFIHCFQSLFRFGFLISPILSLYTGVAPFIAPLPEVIYYFVPFWFVMLALHGWASEYRGSHFWSEVYEVAFCLPALNRLWQMLFRPFGPVSKVTRKGVIMGRKNYNWRLNLPLLGLFLLSVGGMGFNLWGSYCGWWPLPTANLLPQYFWLSYNAIVLAVAILSSIDQPVRRIMDRFPLQMPCRFIVAGEKWPGCTVDLSEQGARIHILPEAFPVQVLPEMMPLELGHPNFRVDVRVVSAQRVKRQIHIQVAFQKLQLEQERELIEILYSSPDAWKQRRKIGGLDSLLALLAALLQLRPILRTYH